MSASPANFERRVVTALSSLYAFRMLGLFMVLPVLALHGKDYEHSSHMLLGLALGAYGCSQALLQIPFGMLSDKLGRKPIIIAGLIIFIIGSVVAALSHSIYGLILGRFLQGCGAIASAIMALVTDLTADENRTAAMASIGASIGVSFAIAFVVGPMLAGFGGMALIFWVTAALGVVGIYIISQKVPQVAASSARRRESGAVPALLKKTLRNRDLLRLDAGIYVLHFILTASFLVVPGIIKSDLGIPLEHFWMIYLPVLGGAFIAMLPFIIVAEKRRKMKPVFLAAVALLAVAELWLAFVPRTIVWIVVGMFVFFMAFNLLEASLPSLISKTAPAGSKGTATGIYSTAQFLGVFSGGLAGGWLLQHYGPVTLFVVCAALIVLWLLLASQMRPPRYLTSMLFTLKGRVGDEVEHLLAGIEGVEEVLIVPSEDMAYLKVDSKRVERAQIEAALQQ